MANEVTFQTRIQSKIDTLANWQAKEATFKPLRGEICVYEIPTGNTSITNPPAMLIRVGDGENYLKDIPFMAARSADVASFLKTDSTGATWTQAKFEAWIKSLIDISDVDTSAFALDADLQQAVKDLQAEVARAKAAEAQALTDAKAYTDEKDTAMDARMDVVEGKAHEHANKALLDTYTQTEANLADAVAKKHEHSNAAVLNGITADKVSAWDAAEQNAKDYADDLDEAMDARMQAVEAKFGEGEGTVEAQIAAAVAAEKSRAEGVEGGLRTDVDAIKGDYLKAEDKTELQNNIDAVKEDVDAFLAAAEVGDAAVDTLKEIQEYITSDGAAADKMTKDIAANATAIATEKSRAEGVESGLETRLQAVEGKLGDEGDVAGDIAAALAEAKSYTDTEVKELADGQVATNKSDIAGLKGLVGSTAVSAQIEAAITALKIGDYAKAADLTAAIGRIAQNESDIEALEGLVGSKAVGAQIDEKIAALKLAETYDAKGAAAAVQSDLDAYKTSNDAAVEAVDKKVDELEIQDLGQTGYFILSCGSSTVNV